MVGVLCCDGLKHANKIWTHKYTHILSHAFCVVRQNLMDSTLKHWLQNAIGKTICVLSALKLTGLELCIKIVLHSSVFIRFSFHCTEYLNLCLKVQN